MMYSIYKITNKFNNKAYIGITKSTVDKRFQQHIKKGDSLISKAINLYGVQHFSVQTLLSYDTTDSEWIKAKESYLIKVNHTLFPHGYNVGFSSKHNVYNIEESLTPDLFGIRLAKTSSFSFDIFRKESVIKHIHIFDSWHEFNSVDRIHLKQENKVMFAEYEWYKATDFNDANILQYTFFTNNLFHLVEVRNKIIQKNGLKYGLNNVNRLKKLIEKDSIIKIPHQDSLIDLDESRIILSKKGFKQ